MHLDSSSIVAFHVSPEGSAILFVHSYPHDAHAHSPAQLARTRHDSSCKQATTYISLGAACWSLLRRRCRAGMALGLDAHHLLGALRVRKVAHAADARAVAAVHGEARAVRVGTLA